MRASSIALSVNSSTPLVVNQTLARRYALAIAQLAHEQHAVERVSADLQTVCGVIGELGLIHDFFISPVVDRPAKERVLAQAFDGKIHSIALHSLLLLVRKRRETLLGAILTQYQALERAARGAEVVTVQSARPLAASDRTRLLARLEAVYRKKFEVTEAVNPSLIGGLRIMMGDRRIDATISGRLNALARDLAEAT